MVYLGPLSAPPLQHFLYSKPLKLFHTFSSFISFWFFFFVFFWPSILFRIFFAEELRCKKFGFDWARSDLLFMFFFSRFLFVVDSPSPGFYVTLNYRSINGSLGDDAESWNVQLFSAFFFQIGYVTVKR